MRAAIFRPKGTDLKSISDFNSDWADRIAFLILVGLAVDIATVFVSNKVAHGVLSILANGLIIAGVWGELRFAKRAREADDGRVAEANKAAAEAGERAAKLEKEAADARGRVADIEWLTAWRRVTQEQRERIAISLRNMASEIDLLVEYERSDSEAFSYGREIIAIFEAAGVTKIRAIPNSYLVDPVFGVHIAGAPPINTGLIADTFNTAHVPVSVFQMDLSKHLSRDDVPPNLYIFVAPKPPPSLWPASDADPTDPNTRAPTNGPTKE
jgi:hypothetical protein